MILGTSRAVHVYAYPGPVDLRKGYDGLYRLVKVGLARDPLGVDLYLFVSRTQLVGGYEGVIVCHALKTRSRAHGSAGISLAGCWAHVFRKFEEASRIIPRPRRR